MRILPFHAALEQESRLANMKEFTSPWSKEECLFLVCTDRYCALHNFYLCSEICSYHLYVTSS